MKSKYDQWCTRLERGKQVSTGPRERYTTRLFGECKLPNANTADACLMSCARRFLKRCRLVLLVLAAGSLATVDSSVAGCGRGRGNGSSPGVGGLSKSLVRGGKRERNGVAPGSPVVELREGDLLVMGGRVDTTFCPRNGATFVQLSAHRCTGAPKLRHSRAGAEAAMLGDKVYLVGGFDFDVLSSVDALSFTAHYTPLIAGSTSTAARAPRSKRTRETAMPPRSA